MRKMLLAAVLLGAVLMLGDGQARAGSPCAVPLSWGVLRSMSPGSYNMPMLAFEAEDGTIRIIPAECKTPAAAVYTIFRL